MNMANRPAHDVVIRGGAIFDGSGRPPVEADIAIDRHAITAVGRLDGARGSVEIDARGRAVAPGFINILSWANESLLEDGRSQSDIRQGVTLEVFGEGHSMGPLTPAMRERMLAEQGDIQFDVEWTTLGGYLDLLERRGVSTNVASFVGATTVRIHELWYDDRPPSAAELRRMRGLVSAAMREGALGVGSSLIYAPACFASTDELVALSAESAAAGGLYVSHIRNEGSRIQGAIDEVLEIARRSGARAHIYHLKSAGRANWSSFESALDRIEGARAAGTDITADMYPYAAGAAGIWASMPKWVQEGGLEAWVERLRDSAIRRQVAAEMRTEGEEWENLLLSAGGADGVKLVGFRSDALKPLTGKTLAEAAAIRGATIEETAMDLVIEDKSRVRCVYFNQSEDVVRRVAGLPWVSLGSDEASIAPEGRFLGGQPHPRAYGTFARFLGTFVRDERIVTLHEAIRRLTSLPAETLRLDRRGRLAPGSFADVVVFDPASIQDHATYESPHRYSTGVEHVFVNGVHTLADGEHTGAKGGQVVRGPGWGLR
jgi:N-acyl-D-amino-acid deacylase